MLLLPFPCFFDHIAYPGNEIIVGEGGVERAEVTTGELSIIVRRRIATPFAKETSELLVAIQDEVATNACSCKKIIIFCTKSVTDE